MVLPVRRPASILERRGELAELKGRQMTNGARREATGGWSPSRRALVSLLVTLHLLAVFTAPWADPPPSSELARAVAEWFRPYAQFMCLNNGYRFFAPDPGPSHLIRYELIGSDGILGEDRFPDRDAQWPRLYYHRHLMLAEMTHQIAAAVPEVPAGTRLEQIMSPREKAEYREQQQRARVIQQSIADYLLSQNPAATSVRLYVQTHAIPTPFDVQRGMRLTDPRLYEERLLGEFSRSNVRLSPGRERRKVS